MKKGKLLLFILVCSMLTACKNDEIIEVESTEIPIPGVETLEWISAYDYSYSEQPDGSLLFTVGGAWDSNQSWSAKGDTAGVAVVEQVTQTEKEAQYLFSPQKAKSGYSEYEVVLSNTETEEELYKFVLSLMGNEEGTKLSILEVYFYEPSEEETAEEPGEESEMTEPDEEELQAQKEVKEAFTEIVGERSFPEAFIIEGYQTETYTRKGKEEQAGIINFVYEDSHFTCTIAPETPLSYFQESFGIEEALWTVAVINDVEVSSYTEEDTRCIMWKHPEGTRFILVEIEVSGNKGFEVAEMMIAQ